MTLLRIIESTLPIELSSSLEAHASVCRSEGWTVEDVFVPKRDPRNNPRGVIDIAEQIIWPWLATNPARPHVFVIGDVPIPRSGINLNPDGHHDTTGAYPCPAYWATGPDGWTDVRDNTGFPSKPQFEHTAGDCVFDQNIIPASSRCAIGILNLTPSAKNKNWGFRGPQSTWAAQAYRRYFEALVGWRTFQYQPITRYAHGHFMWPTVFSGWLDHTDPLQHTFKDPSRPTPFTGPYGILYDLKGLPPNGSFWFNRTKPVAAAYAFFESYQTDWDCSRAQNSLVTGSVCAIPMGDDFDFTGNDTKTFGELWQQTAAQGRQTWFALYGDPTFKL